VAGGGRGWPNRQAQAAQEACKEVAATSKRPATRLCLCAITRFRSFGVEAKGRPESWGTRRLPQHGKRRATSDAASGGDEVLTRADFDVGRREAQQRSQQAEGSTVSREPPRRGLGLVAGSRLAQQSSRRSSARPRSLRWISARAAELAPKLHSTQGRSRRGRWRSARGSSRRAHRREGVSELQANQEW